MIKLRSSLSFVLFVFAIYTVITTSWSLADSALSGNFWLIVFCTIEVISWIYIGIQNMPPWWDTSQENKQVTTLDDSI